MKKADKDNKRVRDDLPEFEVDLEDIDREVNLNNNERAKIEHEMNGENDDAFLSCIIDEIDQNYDNEQKLAQEQEILGIVGSYHSNMIDYINENEEPGFLEKK
eukprot:CAMPEP_0168341586 /NCGR_PEP_ID=MMETSP0213-20121227/14794_1 /TAXON_ID=151035 /ORGANISM="Euplotes harpa, Strain FSP1.4" /LENGTH=102 /DNA_ID=CAMNT_0008348135 /DNA_START=3 /DNA_END=311 /DNA_ORIENTATION=+